MIYVEQYGGWWSFTTKQWREWLLASIADILSQEGYTLPDSKMLRSRPRLAKKDDPASRWWYSSVSTARVIQPLDWTVEQWKEELEKVS